VSEAADAVRLAADRILSWHEHRKRPAARLNPGAASREVLAAERLLGRSLSPQTRAWFQWRNGLSPREGELLGRLWLVPCYYPLSLSESLDERHLSRELEPAWGRWLPFLASNSGDFVALDLAFGDREFAVVEARHARERVVAAWSLLEFLSAVADSFEQGVFSEDESGTLVDHGATWWPRVWI